MQPTKKLLWVNPGKQISFTEQFAPSHNTELEETIERAEVRKLVVWGKNSLGNYKEGLDTRKAK